MNIGKTLFAQFMEHVPWTSFHRIVDRYVGDDGVMRLSCADQFRAMAYAQLARRESLRDIEVTLEAHQGKLYAIRMRHQPRRSTLADANESRDWRIWADLAAVLIRKARKLYRNCEFGLDLANTVYALDSTTIDLCLSFLFADAAQDTEGLVGGRCFARYLTEHDIREDHVGWNILLLQVGREAWRGLLALVLRDMLPLYQVGPGIMEAPRLTNVRILRCLRHSDYGRLESCCASAPIARNEEQSGGYLF